MIGTLENLTMYVFNKVLDLGLLTSFDTSGFLASVKGDVQIKQMATP